MTISQGRLLIKLVDREIGKSSYSIIKDYKSGVSAGFWQGVAKIFGQNLKSSYDPNGEDRMTEYLVEKWQRGRVRRPVLFDILGDAQAPGHRVERDKVRRVRLHPILQDEKPGSGQEVPGPRSHGNARKRNSRYAFAWRNPPRTCTAAHRCP